MNEMAETKTETTVYTLVWGFSYDRIETEQFDDRGACWKRTRAVMAMKNPRGKHVACLKVFRGDGSVADEVTVFERFTAGSKRAKWGEWGATKTALTF